MLLPPIDKQTHIVHHNHNKPVAAHIVRHRMEPYQMSETFKRQPNRIQNYNYSQRGAYFITVCAKGHAPLFGEITVEANSVQHQLSDIGLVVAKTIANIPEIYDMVEVDRYIIMPNHVHLILQMNGAHCAPLRCAPTISRVIKQCKEYVTKQVDFSPWQKSFHDHVIRNQEDYNSIAEYIENNPSRWAEDRYYTG